MNAIYFTAQEVAAMLGVSRGQAYGHMFEASAAGVANLLDDMYSGEED